MAFLIFPWIFPRFSFIVRPFNNFSSVFTIVQRYLYSRINFFHSTSSDVPRLFFLNYKLFIVHLSTNDFGSIIRKVFQVFLVTCRRRSGPHRQELIAFDANSNPLIHYWLRPGLDHYTSHWTAHQSKTRFIDARNTINLIQQINQQRPIRISFLLLTAPILLSS